MTWVLITHAVDDWTAWKQVFDDAAGIRAAAGERDFQVLRDEADPSTVVHLSRWPSQAAARAFFESPELVRIRREAGVHAPDFRYLAEADRGVLGAS
ncbi:MAG: antibiotic biosynthesis monooxygenase [Patulibacter minatonensis]